MLTAAEQQVLDAIAERVDREDPDLAALLTPGRPHRWAMSWLSWLTVYLLVLPWAGIAFVIEPVAAVAVFAVPAALAALGWGRRHRRRQKFPRRAMSRR